MDSSATVTFVFTDIKGSTQRWDRDRDAMQPAAGRHDELMRLAIVQYNAEPAPGGLGRIAFDYSANR